MWTKIQFPEHGMEHANSPWPTSKTTKQKHWKIACQTGLYGDLSIDHMKVTVLVIITILQKKHKQRCSHTPMLKSVNPYRLASTCWNVATVSVRLWPISYPLCIFNSWEQEDRRPTHSLSWPYLWQAGSTGYLPADTKRQTGRVTCGSRCSWGPGCPWDQRSGWGGWCPGPPGPGPESTASLVQLQQALNPSSH